MKGDQYFNTSCRTIVVYGRRVKHGGIVHLSSCRKAVAAAQVFPHLERIGGTYKDRWWTNGERHFVAKMAEWWKRHPWVSQYRVAKTLERSAELSRRTYASVRGMLCQVAREFGVAYTLHERQRRWTTNSTVEDGRLVRGRHLIDGGAPPPGEPVPEDPRMARRRRR